MLKIDQHIDKHRLRGATEVRFQSTRPSMLTVPDIGFPRSFLCSLLYSNTQQQTLVSLCLPSRICGTVISQAVCWILE